MRRRNFLLQPAALAAAASQAQAQQPAQQAQGRPLGAEAFDHVGSKVRITNCKVFGVPVPGAIDRPYVFIKIETNQQGLIGWGEGTLEGKAGAVMACIEDFRDFLIGADPMLVEHHWQSMYVHSFYRAGPVMGSAISAIDQALWDLRGKILNLPVYALLGGPHDTRGVRGYYHIRASSPAQLREIRAQAESTGVTCFKTGIAGWYEFIESNKKISAVVKRLEETRDALGPNIDIGCDFHAKTSPSVASIICKEVEPLKLLFIEEPCPPENVKAMARIARRTRTPIATGERLIASYGVTELVEMGVADIIQTDINHVGGITALWKTAALCEAHAVQIAPHACEGPIGGMATLHVDAAVPNFLVQEICSYVVPEAKEKIWEEWFGFPAMRMVNGRFPLPTKPGLGFDLDERALAKYPFQKTIPMARVFHPDGSVAEW
jgi:galactonate dehydratase